MGRFAQKDYTEEGYQQVPFFSALDKLAFIAASIILVHKSRMWLILIKLRFFFKLVVNECLIETICTATIYRGSLLGQNSNSDQFLKVGEIVGSHTLHPIY